MLWWCWGGFPEIVAEDLGFTIKALEKGYNTVFAKDIMCEERFPIDYLSFKKRNIKWTQGNLEFFKKIGYKIPFMKIPFIKKIDLWFSSTSMSLMVFTVLASMLNLTILIPLGFKYEQIAYVWIFIILFAIQPLINDLIFFSKRYKAKSIIKYYLITIFLYPSMLSSSFITLILGIFGKKAKFLVTPKDSNKYTFVDAVKANAMELIFGIFWISILIPFMIFYNNYLWIYLIWLLFIIVPIVSTIFLTMLSNKNKPEKCYKNK